MKKGKWFYEAQRLFKEYKKSNGIECDYIKQTITDSTLEEEVFLYKFGQQPEVFTLFAYRHTGEVYLLPKQGAPIRIYLQQRNDLSNG